MDGMSRYAYDAARHALLASWGTGHGDLAATVAEFSPTVKDTDAIHLAFALTELSTALWNAYTHPASAAGDPTEANTEAWRRSETREAFAEVHGIIQDPNLPYEDGTMTVCYDPVEESAHRVGRAVHRISQPALLDAVLAEARQEVAAVESAELGDLSARAQQAVLLSRPDASPLQVHAADRLLHENPLGSDALFTDLDPTAAAVAAAHWLRAAAQVTADLSGIAATRVVLEADNIEALPVQTPTLVLERMHAGQSPRRVVLDLVQDAITVAEGGLRDPHALTTQLAGLEESAAAYPEQQRESLREALLSEFRTTPLDPARPARDLLEDLLAGIRGCWLIYHEYADLEDEDEEYELDDSDGEERNDPESPDNEEEDERAFEAERERIDDEFIDDVREQAEATNHDLT
jgi:hypothetical protein